MIKEVRQTTSFEKKLEKLKKKGKLPQHLVDKYETWGTSVSLIGVAATGKAKGYRDHKLYGNWKDHRAICLNETWRVIYHIVDESEGKGKKRIKVEIVEVVEVTDHDYSKKK